MDELARRFARAAKQRRGLRYSPALRQLALEYARTAEVGGRTRRQIAESLGLSEVTLGRWQRTRATAAPVHEVVGNSSPCHVATTAHPGVVGTRFRSGGEERDARLAQAGDQGLTKEGDGVESA